MTDIPLRGGSGGPRRFRGRGGSRCTEVLPELSTVTGSRPPLLLSSTDTDAGQPNLVRIEARNSSRFWY
jgi:hypothetical protein